MKSLQAHWPLVDVRRSLVFIVSLIVCVGIGGNRLIAQNDQFGINPNQFGNFAQPSSAAQEPVTLEADYTIEKGSRRGKVHVTAHIAQDWYIYALDQEPPMQATEVLLGTSDDYQLTGKWKADAKPVSKFNDLMDVTEKKYFLQVTFTAPIKVAPEVDPTSLTISVNVTGQVCNQGCQLLDVSTTASFKEYTEPSSTSTKPRSEYRPKGAHVAWSGHVAPSQVRPGDTVTVTLKGVPDPDYHLYPYSTVGRQSGANLPTLIEFRKPSGWTSTPVKASPKPKPKPTVDGETVLVHASQVEWSFDVEVPTDAEPGAYTIGGIVAFQTCKKTGCDRPLSARFESEIQVGDTVDDKSQQGLSFESGPNYFQVAKAMNEQSNFDIANLEVERTEYALLPILLIAIGGGFILNFMPCVLPVIGLKVMSFVQQAGSDRRQAFMLNVWYALGILAVFLVLATLIAFYNFGWGTQNQSIVYQVVMTAIVFVMGLSFLGVWEIPIPGFVGTSKAADFAEKEGVLAAFLKGVLTTILAVPCTGPLLAVALSWCTGKPPSIVYLVFSFLALGMALPYVVIGMKPSLIKFLPKPGAWMETFKQIMGFFLIGTVVWLLTIIRWDMVVPTVAFLFSLWVACWVVGRIPVGATAARKARSWATAVAVGALLGYVSLGWLGDVMQYRYQFKLQQQLAENGAAREPSQKVSKDGAKIDWQPFTFERLESEIAKGNTVFIEFTADWCLTCKSFKSAVLERKPVRELIQKNGVVPMSADWTDENDKLGQFIEQLSGAQQIPILAIFPADNPNKPLVFGAGGYTLGTVLDKLKQAGPSKDAQSVALASGAKAETSQESSDDSTQDKSETSDHSTKRSTTENGHPAVSQSEEGSAAPAPDKKGQMRDRKVAWRPFSFEALEGEVRSGKTVFIEFTADWCLTCKALKKKVLEDDAVRQLITQNGVVAMTADWTESNARLGELIEELAGAPTIPLLAIYPAGTLDEPLVVGQTTYNKDTVLTKLKQAGPSKNFSNQ